MDVDHRSKVPIFAVFTTIPFLVGGVIWLTTIDQKASSANADIKGVRELVLDIRERVVRIETQINKEKR